MERKIGGRNKGRTEENKDAEDDKGEGGNKQRKSLLSYVVHITRDDATGGAGSMVRANLKMSCLMTVTYSMQSK
jgi:hypothetical protein